MLSVSRKMVAANSSLYLSLVISSTKAAPEAPDTLPAWEYNHSVIVIGLVAHLRTRRCRVQNPKIPVFSRMEYTPKNWTKKSGLESFINVAAEHHHLIAAHKALCLVGWLSLQTTWLFFCLPLLPPRFVSCKTSVPDWKQVSFLLGQLFVAYVKGSVGVVRKFSFQVPSRHTFLTIVVFFFSFFQGVNASHERR